MVPSSWRGISIPIIVGCLLTPLAAAGQGAPPQITIQGPEPVPGAPPAAGSFASPIPPPVVLPPPPVLTDTQARLEAARLAGLFRAEVRAAVPVSRVRRALMVELARTELERHGQKITRPQILVVVDRSPAVQLLELVVAYPDQPWTTIGATRVSTGQSGRKLYFITPTGVFENTNAILGYRAQGTFNEHHIRGNGLKGMRVWDFGWHEAVKGWLPDRVTGQIRLEMHATDPEFLESRLGRPASEGCVRIPSAMNRFLDLHGVLDVDYERAAAEDIRFRALLLPNREPTKLAGKMLVVIDSEDPERTT